MVRLDVSSIGFGVIGLGRIGAFHAESLRMPSAARIWSAAAVDPDHRRHLLESGARAVRPGGKRRSLLARPDVEAVVVASPAVVHDEHIALAAAAGKPIFSEKPLADTVAKARSRGARGAGGGSAVPDRVSTAV